MYTAGMEGANTTRLGLSGRQAQAARNDALILEAAREVFTADPNAPIAAVAERAGVGISALYRRYRSKDELLQRLSLEGLRRYIAEVEAALANEIDPWAAFAAFMRRAVDADTHSLTLHLAGTFTPTQDHWRDGEHAAQLTTRLIERTQAADALRRDVDVGDLSLIFQQLAAIDVGDAERSRQLRHRYLALFLDALHDNSAPPLPGPPPAWDEISGQWAR
ncbi:MAG: TetR/AcrR family transcriptional regulator [Thermomicrobiales bacterium]